MLEQENAFYDAHQAEFREKYLDKWLVISGEALFGAYDKFADAAKAALERFGQDGFMIHKPSDDGKVIEIPSVTVTYPKKGKKAKMRPEMSCSSGGPVTVAYPY